MGKLVYDSTMTVEFEDRLLAHLHTVIIAKLRRGEAFAFIWKDDHSSGDGRTSVWLHPSIPLAFTFYGGRAPQLNRAWIEALMNSANSAHGLQVVPEPDGPAHPATGSIATHL
jgi:hypothetical protein